MRSWTLVLAVVCACERPAFFAQRPVVTSIDDEHPIAQPRERVSTPLTNGVDADFFRPLSRALALQSGDEAADVNALDEVPDSSWYTNRDLGIDAVRRGPCLSELPAPPLTVLHAKTEGATVGAFVRDARGQRYVLKLDHAPDQPEVASAADAIVSRLYYAAGYNVPCYRVAYVRADEIRFAPDAYQLNALGHRRPLEVTPTRAALGHAIHDRAGRLRVDLSLFVDGVPLGPWPATGRRDDDPNDQIAHEDRRELRGERLLAAWVNHWDSVEDNSLDSFVRTADDGRGYVRHWFIDFGDALGEVPASFSSGPALGYVYAFDLIETLERTGMFGVVRQPYERLTVDPAATSLRYFSADRFDPVSWRANVRMLRHDLADIEDLAWMARKIARIDALRIRAAVDAGKFTDPRVSNRVVEVLVDRRERILRWAFAHATPLDSLHVTPNDELCGTDLEVLTGIGSFEPWSLRFVTRQGHLDARLGGPLAPELRGTDVCFALPLGLADTTHNDDAYRIAEISHGRRGPTIRVHVVNIGMGGGYAIVGVER